MKLSERDQKIVMVLLPALVALLYWQVWLKDALGESRGLRQKLVGLGAAPQLSARLNHLAAERELLQRQERELPPEPAVETAAPAVVRPRPSGGLLRLQEFLRAAGVRLVSAAVVAPDDFNLDDRDSVAIALERSGSSQPRHWRLMVEADYATMVRLLKTCGEDGEAPIIESLELRPGAGDGRPAYWSIVLCL